MIKQHSSVVANFNVNQRIGLEQLVGNKQLILIKHLVFLEARFNGSFGRLY